MPKPKKRRGSRGGSRGRAKPSLHDLSREALSADDLMSFMDGVGKMDARAVALVLAAAVEDMIENCIADAFVPLTEPEFNDLFRVRSAPIGLSAPRSP